MAKGNLKSSHWGIIIDPPKNEPTKARLQHYQALLPQCEDILFYASIIHDKDTDVDGTIKVVHLHIYLHSNKITKRHVLDTLTNLLNCEEDQITANASNNDFLLSQYLTHKNQPTKYQYPYEDIQTSDIKQLETLYNKEYKQELSEEDLQEILLNATSIIEVINKIGSKRALQYSRLWQLVQKEKSTLNKDALIFTLQDFIVNLIQTINNNLTNSERKQFFTNILNFEDIENRYLEICNFYKISPRY